MYIYVVNNVFSEYIDEDVYISIFNISRRMKYKVSSKGNIAFSLQSRKNKEGLVGAFPCSRAPEPWSQGDGGGGGTPRHGNPGQRLQEILASNFFVFFQD